ncbi:MAG TPA: hypothetical protein PKC09_00325 [Paracoccus sp. (in: a-proteobacteria)]|uniref:hypothetical protein n=1 Tax=uncultured Paracoccus sp. TaxID=189685 RepID=UPI00263A04D7|nr:hypothetical protein [uncultured Paracoccus sp.]HMQ39689.1 hypothetical protein [Paracoccus sp. (in: a-proteobacteria)]HMR34825.1 hypothetical protein [Paracoccus sp. (in: a-proteobacteria)]
MFWKLDRMAIPASVSVLGLAVAAEARDQRGWNLHVPDYPGSIAMDAGDLCAADFAVAAQSAAGGLNEDLGYHADADPDASAHRFHQFAPDPADAYR